MISNIALMVIYTIVFYQEIAITKKIKKHGQLSIISNYQMNNRNTK